MSDNDNPYAGSAAGGYSTNASLQGQATMPAAPSFQPKPAGGDGGGGGGEAAGNVSVKDVTTETFMADVIEASRANPVVVDFWAPWCGPCKQLGPIIEKIARETKGVTLCKMDVEQYPEVSGQMGIQSIPAVVAFVDGRPADAFMGAKPEGEVRRFFEKIATKVKPDAEGENLAAAMDQAGQLMVEGDHGTAAEIYGAVLAKEPGNIDAFAGLGQCYVAVGEVDMAQMLIEKIPEEHRDRGPLVALAKAIELARQASDLGGLSELAAAVEANPGDHQARLDYALALNSEGQREAAAEQLIAIVRADRKWKDDGARTQLLEFFEAWGHMDPATVTGRRALSSILFS
ncbi:MAG: co-chaperone YbbN [Rhizobiaceae bacterium]